MEIKKCKKCGIELETYIGDGSKTTKSCWFCPECVQKVIQQRIENSGLKEGEYYIVNGTVVKKTFTSKDSCKIYYYNCKYCGELKVTRFKQRKYCSKECHSLDIISDRRDYYQEYKQNKYDYAPMINYTCEICNKHFQDNKPNRRFCCLNCQKEHIKRNRISVAKPTKFCLTCGQPSKRKDYCSEKCKPRPPKKIRKTFKLTCKTCGKDFESIKSDKTTCSKSCYIRTPEYRKLVNDREREKRKSNTNFTKIKGKTNIKVKVRKRNRKYGNNTLKGISLDGFIDLEKIRKSGQQTDHIIPLNGETVSGLNVPWNLQLLTCEANNFKSNKFDGTYENKSWIKEYRKKKMSK